MARPKDRMPGASNCRKYHKITKSNTLKELNTSLYSESKRDIWTGEVIQLKPEEILAKGPKMLTWLRENQRVMTIEKWLLHDGTSRKTWQNWLERYPELKEYQETAKHLLGERREDGLIFADLNMKDVQLRKSHWRYSEGALEDAHFEAEIKAKIAAAGKTDQSNKSFTVILEAVGETAEVSDKIKKDKERELLEDVNRDKDQTG